MACGAKQRLRRTAICTFRCSPGEQLERFKQRLDDPQRHWKISEADYSERELWKDYFEAFEEAIEKMSTGYAPW